MPRTSFRQAPAAQALGARVPARYGTYCAHGMARHPYMLYAIHGLAPRYGECIASTCRPPRSKHAARSTSSVRPGGLCSSLKHHPPPARPARQCYRPRLASCEALRTGQPIISPTPCPLRRTGHAQRHAGVPPPPGGGPSQVGPALSRGRPSWRGSTQAARTPLMLPPPPPLPAASPYRGEASKAYT